MTEAELRERPPSDSTLQCPICSKLLREAVKTPCCSKTFCEECAQTHLLERDFSCPGCQKKISSLDMLIPDNATRNRVKKYTEEEIAKSEEAANAASETGKEVSLLLQQCKSSPSLRKHRLQSHQSLAMLKRILGRLMAMTSMTLSLAYRTRQPCQCPMTYQASKLRWPNS